MAKIVLNNVEINYPIYDDQHYSLRRTLVNLTTRGKLYRDTLSTSYRALDNISFTLQQGDRLGLIGNNGAGKTTLLKTMAQLYKPTRGSITIEGKVSTLFDVCMGIDIDRSGYHNIFYMGALLGLTRAQIKTLVKDIEDFCEIGSFLNMPVRTYSAGMRIRLGFAICTCIDPTILLLDEAIGVGDKHFIAKASARAKALYDRAEILVLASHSIDVLKEFCNKALWLHKGKMVMLGDVDDVLKAYATRPELAETT